MAKSHRAVSPLQPPEPARSESRISDETRLEAAFGAGVSCPAGLQEGWQITPAPAAPLHPEAEPGTGRAAPAHAPGPGSARTAPFLPFPAGIHGTGFCLVVLITPWMPLSEVFHWEVLF